MDTILARSSGVIAVLALLLTTSLLNGCGSSFDIKAEDDKTSIYSFGVTKPVLPKMSIDVVYSQSDGEGTQKLDDGAIQLDRQRVKVESEPLLLNSEFTIKTGRAGVTFHLVDISHLTLDISPGVRFLEYELETRTTNTRLSKKDQDWGGGFNLRLGVPFSDRIGMEADLGVYDTGTLGRFFFDRGVSVNFHLNDYITTHLGYRSWRINDDNSDNNSDICFSSDEPKDCDDSEVEFLAEGFSLGLHVLLK